jgi:hypothetical protein
MRVLEHMGAVVVVQAVIKEAQAQANTMADKEETLVMVEDIVEALVMSQACQVKDKDMVVIVVVMAATQEIQQQKLVQ